MQRLASERAPEGQRVVSQPMGGGRAQGSRGNGRRRASGESRFSRSTAASGRLRRRSSSDLRSFSGLIAFGPRDRVSGAARSRDDSTRAGLRKRRVASEVDVWALGCMAVEILSGRLPHEESEPTRRPPVRTRQSRVPVLAARTLWPADDPPNRPLMLHPPSSQDPLIAPSIADQLHGL